MPFIGRYGQANRAVATSADDLRGRYPDPEAYREQFEEATARAVAVDFLLEADAEEITTIAALNRPSW